MSSQPKNAKIDLNKVAMVFGLLTCGLVIATGVVGAIRSPPNTRVTFANVNNSADANTQNNNAFWSVFIVCVVLILFGLLGILAELGIRIVRNKLGFFFSFWTRAAFYAVLGILVFGVAGDLGISTTIVCGVEVIFLIILGFIADPPKMDNS